MSISKIKLLLRFNGKEELLTSFKLPKEKFNVIYHDLSPREDYIAIIKHVFFHNLFFQKNNQPLENSENIYSLFSLIYEINSDSLRTSLYNVFGHMFNNEIDKPIINDEYIIKPHKKTQKYVEIVLRYEDREDIVTNFNLTGLYLEEGAFVNWKRSPYKEDILNYIAEYLIWNLIFNNKNESNWEFILMNSGLIREYISSLFIEKSNMENAVKKLFKEYLE